MKPSRIGLWLGPLLFLAILLFADLQPGQPLVTRMAAVATLMAVWWISEAIPLAATSLLPLILFPLLGIMGGKETAPIYVNHVIFLFVGGFMIALAMEQWGLHKRIALWIIRLIGGGPSRLVLSFMLASAILSMWISNTATAIMMLAIGLAIIGQLEQNLGADKTHRLSVALLLAIAYGASVGGMATLVGTPPNLSFVRIFEIIYPAAGSVSFGQWMLLGLPLTAVMMIVIWLLLTKVFFRSPADLRLSPEVVRREYRALGSLRFAEAAVLAVFCCTALLWVFRKELVVGAFTLPGWADLLPFPGLIDDGTVAITMALLLFLIPSRAKEPQASRALLDLSVFRRLPWHIVLLFGGGFALAQGFQSSGLSGYVGGLFAGLEGASPLAMIAAVCTSLTFLTELTSNTATTELLLPILASAATTLGVNPLMLMVPATLAASCAFMMPVATPPNAIIFGSGRIKIVEMATVGIVVNLIGIVVITALFLLLGMTVFGIEPGVVPEWVTTTT
jgi:sodium-dependent dicarboxylate transporter 2/3/5